MRTYFSILLLFFAGTPWVRAAEPPKPVSITTLVGLALAGNPEVQFYESEILRAKADRSVAGRLPNPELNLDVGRRSVRSSDASGSGLAWAVSLAQPIEWSGRLGLRKAIANSDIALAELGLARFKSVVAGKVRSLAYALLTQQERAAAAAEVQDRLTALKDVIVQRDPAGVTPLLESKIIEASAVTVQKQAGDAAVAMQKALLELNQLMGRRADSPLVVQRTEFSYPEYAELSALLSRAARDNYDIRVRLRELEQQGLKVELAKNERYPTVTIGPSFSQARTDERETEAGIGISIPLPLWNNGKASVTAAEARRMQAQASLMMTLRDIERQVTEATLLYQTHRQRLTGWKPETLKSFRDAAGLADRHYRLGAVEVATYVEMQEKYLEAVDAINETKAEALEAALTLEQLIGQTDSLIPSAAVPRPASRTVTKTSKSKK